MKIKNHLLALTLFISFFTSYQLNAETGEQVCASISFSSDREECRNFLTGRYFDLDAGWVCINARFNSGKLECVQVSADKEYTLSEAHTCNDESFDDDRNECMRAKGRPVDDDNSYIGRLRTIKRLARRALSHLASRNYQAAYTVIEKIIFVASVDEE